MKAYRLSMCIIVLCVSIHLLWTEIHAQGAFVWTTYTEVKPVMCLAVDREDAIWAGSRTGISRFDGSQWTTYTRADGLPSDDVRDVCIDRQGNVWIATWRGAGRFDGKAWTTFTVEDGLGGNRVNTIVEDQEGSIWFGLAGAGATRFNGMDWVTYTAPGELPSNIVQSFTIDKLGGIWFGTSGGASRFDGTDWRIYRKQDGLVHDNIRCVTQDMYGSVWFGTPGGISRFDEMRWVRYGREHGLPDNNVLSLLEDDRGFLWVGTWSGVSRYDGESWMRYTEEDGLGGGRVQAIVQDEEGVLWFGTGGGLTSLERRVDVGRFVYTLGKGRHTWKDAGDGVNPDFDTGSGILRPRKLSATENLATRALEWGGRIWSSWYLDDPEELGKIIDGSLYSRYMQPIFRPRTVYLDLGGAFTIQAIEIYPAGGESPTIEDQLPQELEVGLSLQDPEEVERRGVPDLRPFWRGIIDGFSPVRITGCGYNRYIGITVSRTDMLRLFEIKVFDGGSYLPKASYVSGVIDLSDIAGWGKIWWRGEKPSDAEVSIQTRSGTDEDPNVYWRYSPGRDHQTHLTPEGLPLTRADYGNLKDHLKGRITSDTKNWTFWSVPYPWEAGTKGTPIVSPGPRRYLQIRVDFRNTADGAGELDYLSFEYSQPPSAHEVYAEILPTDVNAAVRTTFTYVVRPRIGGDDTGFDSVEILTPVPVDRVRSVKIDGREVSFEVELLDDPARFIVHFSEDRMDIYKDNAVLEVRFDCVVYRHGTAFEGWVFDSQLGQIHQRVTPGNAREGMGEDEISVRIDVNAPLIVFLRADPNPFTPNGDGINDEVTIFYAVSKVTQPISVEIVLYDLSGTRVRKGYAGEGGIGPYTWRWDGRDDRGELLPPGVYVYRISIYPDIGLSARTGTVHMVY